MTTTFQCPCGEVFDADEVTVDEDGNAICAACAGVEPTENEAPAEEGDEEEATEEEPGEEPGEEEVEPF